MTTTPRPTPAPPETPETPVSPVTGEAPPSNRGWYAFGAISAALLAATYWEKAGYPGAEAITPLVLSQENNIGAWWSGMSLLASCVVACSVALPLWRSDRRASLAFAGIAFLTFGLCIDEIGSLHERASLIFPGDPIQALAFPAAAGAVVLAASLTLLWRRRHAFPGVVPLIAIAFALFGSVFGQEVIEHKLDWPDSLLPIRVVIEEGTELTGMALLLLAVIRAGRTLGRTVRQRLDDLTGALGIVALAALVATPPLLALAILIAEDGFRPNWGNFTTTPPAMLFAVAAWGCAVHARRRIPLHAAWLIPAVLLLFLSIQSIAHLIGSRFHETAATGALRTLAYGLPLAAAVLLATTWRNKRRVAALLLAPLLAGASFLASGDTLSLAIATLAAGILVAGVLLPEPPHAAREPGSARS